MGWRRPVLITIIAFLPCTFSDVGWAQSSRSADQAVDDDAGFWPTRKMVDLFLVRTADDITRRYSLDEKQREALLADMRGRWPAFMNKHRQTLQPLINDVIEMRLADETPSPEKAAEWASQVMPLLEDAKRNIEEGTSEMARVLNPDQRKRLQTEMAAFNMGYNFMTARAKAWQEGKFKPSDWPTERRRRNRERGGDGAAARGAASAPVEEAPKSAWRRYVEQFAEENDLSETQRRAAEGILKDMEERAAPLFRDYDNLVAALRMQSPSERDAAKPRRERLEGDLEKRFAELRQRLDALLTSAQRARGKASGSR